MWIVPTGDAWAVPHNVRTVDCYVRDESGASITGSLASVAE